MIASKFLWLNLISIALLVLQYFVVNDMFVQYALWEGLLIAILNSVAGMIQGQQLVKSKLEVSLLKSKLESFNKKQ